MELVINHKKKFVNDLSFTLERLIQLEKLAGSKGIAVAVNNIVIPKKSWTDTILKDKDSILIITATQGG